MKLNWILRTPLLACACVLLWRMEARSDTPSLTSASGNLSVVFSDNGEMTSISLRNTAGAVMQRAVTGRSIFAGTTAEDVRKEGLADGGVRFVRTIRSSQGQEATVTETFAPGSEPDSIAWTLVVEAAGEPWTTSIQSYLQIAPVAGDLRFWSAWTRPDLPQVNGYANPLASMPFSELHLKYGGAGNSATETSGVAVPIASWLHADEDFGLSLVQSPLEFTQDMTMHTSSAGAVNFERTLLRIGGGNTIRLHSQLVAHPADWRAGLGFMTRVWPAAFDPSSPEVHAVGGGATYADYRGEPLDAEHYRAMGFTMNWSATFPWPYIGMSLPPVQSHDETWQSLGGTERSGHVIVPTSMCATVMNSYGAKMREQGFHQLEYFTVTEAGNFIESPAPPRKAADDADLWKDPNDFLYYQIPDANLGISSWLDCRVVDPGEPAWQREILRQMTDIAEKLPACSGICIDRLDHLKRFNPAADDGVTWTGAPKRSLIYSWHAVMDKLVPIATAHSKVVFGNAHIMRRIDVLRHLDGFYSEFRHPGIQNLLALAGVRKPVVIWDSPVNDAGFQEHLYLGTFPSVPFPKANHNTLPNAALEALFKEYGALFNAMRGKKWVLLPHVIEVAEDNAVANIFAVNEGYVIPVVFGGSARSVRVNIRNLPPSDLNLLEILHPGNSHWIRLKRVDGLDAVSVDVPLHRGCAMLRIRKGDGSRSVQVINGGFELPSAPPSTYLPWGTAVDGWMTENAAYPPLVISESFGGVLPAAPEGGQWGLLDFRISHNGGGCLLQFVGVVEEGRTYHWRVTLGNRGDVDYLAPPAFGLYSLSAGGFKARSVKSAADVAMPQRSRTAQTFEGTWDSTGFSAEGEPLYFRMELPVYSGPGTAQLLIDDLSVATQNPGTVLSLCLSNVHACFLSLQSFFVAVHGV